MAAHEIVAVPPDRLDELQPLWRALSDHQRALTPHLRDREVPFDAAWASRRRLEAEWLRAEPRSFALAVRDAGRYLGYAFVRVRPGAGFAASWALSDPLADLATLVVLPELRGQGIGSALLDSVETRLAELGIADMMIGVVTTNIDAIRFYEQRGAVPFVTDFLKRVGPG